MEIIANKEQINRAKNIYKWLNLVKLHKIIFRLENENRPIEIIYIDPKNNIERYIPYINDEKKEIIKYIYKQ